VAVSGTASAAKEPGNVSCREGLTSEQRQEIATKLQRITGWSDLAFDSEGILRLGHTDPVGGSLTARTLLLSLLRKDSLIFLEEANKRSDIAFSQVSRATLRVAENSPTRQAHVVSIDFSDFEHVAGHPLALAAFDIGWVLLHEFDHILNGSTDATLVDTLGDCEAYINQMRRELSLPTRAHYFFINVPLSATGSFVTSWVRMAFDRQSATSLSKRRYWLIWDASLVGGTIQTNQIASLTRH
jgi:hypothetical protein